MRAPRPVWVIVVVGLFSFCLLTLCLSTMAAAQSSDKAVAERVFGPQWKQLSRRAGMIFTGTVVSGSPVGSRTDRDASAVPSAAVELRFRVDRAVAGVEAGQIVTIREWAGAASMHRPVSVGEHVLIFLYPPSRLGLTSPVGGSLGLVILDGGGEYVRKDELLRRNGMAWRPVFQGSVGVPVPASCKTRSASVEQLERAIRSAREE